MAPPIYEKDEKVLCFHHEMLYEAKVLDTRQEDKNDKKSGFQYLVHYKGWKNTWDDWVPQDRLRKHNEENLELARNLKKEIDRASNMARTSQRAAATISKKKGVSSTRPSEERSTPQQLAGKKRVRDADTERIDDWRDKPQIRLPFPDILRSILVDDWENVTWLNLMVPLPSPYPISVLLDEYRAFQSSNVVAGSVSASILDELTAGIREYFNLALSRILLYKQERRQYVEWRKRVQDQNDSIHDPKPKELHDIYGPEHFLRLLVKMPELTAQTNLDVQSMNRLREELMNILMWLSQKPNLAKYFTEPYVDNSFLEEAERNGPSKHDSTTAEA